MTFNRFLVGMVAVLLVVNEVSAQSNDQVNLDSAELLVEPVVIAQHAVISDTTVEHVDVEQVEVEAIPAGVLEPQEAVSMESLPDGETFPSDSGSCCDGACGSCQKDCCRFSRCCACLSRLRCICPRPSCNMSQHMPYRVPTNYYYYRPYSPLHVDAQREQSLLWSDRRDTPYSNASFQGIYDRIEQEFGLQR